MRITKRILALLLSAAVLLAPLGVAAEGYVVPAGEVTGTAISDFYVGGMQIDVTVGFGMQSEGEPTARMRAAQTLLEKMRLSLSFYDDFGTARVRGALTLDGATLLTLDALVSEDGSAKFRTNLTGESVLALPAGTLTENGVNLGALSGNTAQLGVNDPGFEDLPAWERLSIAFSDLQVMLMGHMLGWISYTQRDTGELYVFDYDYVDATDTRDEVGLRMISKIPPWNFMDLLTNILWTLRDETGALQQALADVLAQAGVTRYQVRQLVDGLFTRETLDPAVDWVQPSATVYDDGALCTKDDIAYAIKKLDKSAQYVMEGTEELEAPEQTMTMVISYNDFGTMVGLDMDVPIISEYLPYEGALNYSVKTDEADQLHHTAHGEFELMEGNRVVGEASMQTGRDVNGVKQSGLSGTLEVRQGEAGTSFGVGVDTGLTFRTDGEAAETFEASAAVSLLRDGAASDVLTAGVQGETNVADEGFLITAQANVSALGATLTADVAAQANDYDGVEFLPGPAVDLTDAASLEQLQQQILSRAMGVYLNLSGNQDVMTALLTLIGL